MRYRVTTSNKEGSFTIQEEELSLLYECLNKNTVGIFREGWLNPSHFVALVEDKKRISEILEAERTGVKYDEPSPFAEIAKRLSLHSKNKKQGND